MRNIDSCQSIVKTDKVESPPDLRTWVETEATKHNLRWLLAHCHDGVIWGELRDGALALSCEAFPERGLALRWETLQQARLFGETGELLLWPGPTGWRATLRHDQSGEGTEYIDEEHLLWGNKALASNDGFIKVAEGSQGVVHAPPIIVAPTDEKKSSVRARLKVRHYLDEDEAGVTRVVASRVVELISPKGKTNA
jgi:CRISPR-associated protein (TIGR03984 family)